MRDFSETWPGSWHAFEMLRRLVFRGPVRSFNPEIAAELVSADFARIDGGELVATQRGIRAERSVMELPLPIAA